MRHSVVWYYQELARRIGEARMRQHVSALGYGSRDIGSEVDTFWLTGALTISPREQVEFLRRFDAYELPVARRSIDVVRKLIVLEKTREYTLSGKTGLADGAHGGHGWLVGYLESRAGTAYYALLLERGMQSAETLIPARLRLVREVLHEVGLI
jgi:beta-lactamase class D